MKYEEVENRDKVLEVDVNDLEDLSFILSILLFVLILFIVLMLLFSDNIL